MAKVCVSHGLPLSDIKNITPERPIELIMSVMLLFVFPSPCPNLNAQKSIKEDLNWPKV